MSKSEGDSGLDSQISSQPQQNDSFDRTQLYEGMSALSRSSETGTQDRAGDSGSLNFNTNELYRGLDSSYPQGNASSGAMDFSPTPVSTAHGQREVAGNQQDSSLPPMAGAEMQGEAAGSQQDSSLPPMAGAEMPGEAAGNQQDSSLPPMAGADLQHSGFGSPASAGSPDLSGAQDFGAIPGSPFAAGQAEPGVMHSAAHSGNALDGQSRVASAEHFAGRAGDGQRGDSQRGDAQDVQPAGALLPSLSGGNAEGTMSPRERNFQSWSGYVAQPSEGALKSTPGDAVEPQRSAEADAGDASAIKGPGDKAKELIEAARTAEPRVTEDLQKLAGENGGQMVGLEHRLKSEESMTRKISDGYPAEKVVDALRYTMVFPPEALADGVQSVRGGMQTDGYNEIKLNNSYEDSRFYKGINAAYEKDGQKFELQFHTPQSFDIKNGDNHKLYEVTREMLHKDEDGKNALKEKPQIDEVLNKHMAVLEKYPNLAEMSNNFLSATGTIAEKDIRSLASHILLRATQQQIKNYASMVMPDNISSVTNVDRRK